MKRLSDLTEHELLIMEDAWWEREDESNQSWINEGVRIFQNLSRHNAKEIRYKETLAYLLLMQGEDMKLRQHSYEKAIQRFKQVVKIDTENARAYYRLGFLYFYLEEWANSIQFFQQALNRFPRQSRNQLDQEQKIKAHHYILKATQIIAVEVIGKVDRIPKKDLDLFGEIKLLVKEIKGGFGVEGLSKPYQMIVNGVEFSDITENEYEQLSDIYEHNSCIILNQRTINDTTIALYEREIHIPRNQVPLLEYLMRNPEGVCRGDIIQKRYRQSRNPEAALRQNISRLRTRLEPLDPLNQLIQTIDGGYRWNWKHEYRMFKHNRDVSSDMLLE